METIENTIIQNLVTNEEYTRKVLPFLKPDYFDKTHEKIIFDECAKFIVEYDKCPTKEILSISFVGHLSYSTINLAHSSKIIFSCVLSK